MARLTHLNCKNPRCELCLEQHLELERELAKLTGNDKKDHLGALHRFLSKRGVSPETEHGWGTQEYFDETNIAEYVTNEQA